MLVAGLLACWSTAAQNKPFYEKSEAMAPQGDDHTRGRGGGPLDLTWDLAHIYINIILFVISNSIDIYIYI